jgi:peptide chain release factor subunit 1
MSTRPSAAREPSAPINETFGIGTLERLAKLDTRGHPVVSLYLDLDPARFPTPAARDTQLAALLAHARRGADEPDAERVRAMMSADPTITRGARGLAIFSSARADVLEAIRLPSSVEPLAVVDTVPWLEPLVAMVSPGDWGVAVIGRRSARLFRGGLHSLIEFTAVEDELHRRHAQGGPSQARFQRGIEEEVAVHVRGVAERLLRAHLRRPFQQLVIVASDELRPVIGHNLHAELSEVLAGTIDADLEHASPAQIAQAVGPVIENAEREHERTLVGRLEQALATGGAAAAGLDEVLSTLAQQRVETLLVPEGSRLAGGLCRTCGRLSSTELGRCPLDGTALEEIDAVEHAINEAVRQSATVIVARHETAWLAEHGALAALLRW